MASEITLKYLHPSIKTYITTENYKYDTSTAREVLFVADVFDHGVDNKLQQVNTLSEFLFKYGEPDFDRFGQAAYNVEKWLTNGNSAVIMRLLPEDASYAHAVFNIQYKNATNGKTVINAQGEETKINDVYLRPLVTYIGVNNTSEKLIENELAEDRRDYPTTDGYLDNFIFAIYPEGRGEYYNDLGFRIRLNPSYDGVLTSRVYTFEVIKFSGSTYDIIDGPYYVSFDPDAIDPNSQKSMYFENVVNSYSPYLRVKVNEENYIKLASIINDEVDPYIIDIITGQSRQMPNGDRETYFSSITGKDEDVHVSLRKYSSNGIALTNNGEYILNISNNDETTKDIVDIADNARRVVYNNQKYITQYMRSFYNWLIQDRIEINLTKIIDGNIENNISDLGGLLKTKAYNLIYANTTNSDATTYTYDNTTFFSNLVGKKTSNKPETNENYSWYLKTQEVNNPGLKNKLQSYVGTNKNNTGYENADETYTSTSDLIKTITEDGFILDTNEHLISYYNNFMKYIQFVANYDAYNNNGFVVSGKMLEGNRHFNDMTNTAKVYALVNKNSSKDNYNSLGLSTLSLSTSVNYSNFEDNTENLVKENFVGDNYKNIAEYVINNLISGEKKYGTFISSNLTNFKNARNTMLNGDYPMNTSVTNKLTFNLFGRNNTDRSLATTGHPVYIDDTEGKNKETYIPIVDFKTYNENGVPDVFGTYVKVYNLLGEEIMVPITGLGFLTGGWYYQNSSVDIDKTIVPLFEKYCFPNPGIEVFDSEYSNRKNIVHDFYIFDKTCKDANKKSYKYTVRPGVPVGSLKSMSLTADCDAAFNILYTLNNYFGNSNPNDYIIVAKPNTAESNVIVPENVTYEQYNENKSLYKGCYEISLISYIKFYSELLRTFGLNKEGNAISLPGNTEINRNMYCTSIGAFMLPIETITKVDEEEIVHWVGAPVETVINKYISFNVEEIKPDIPVFDEIFNTTLKNGKLTQAFNKANSYAALISKELDGKGVDHIDEDVNNVKTWKNLDYTDYSLTTIFNLLVGGFESIVNNQGSITDYSNYASLKYLMKTVNNNLDLRSTYLTLLNVHKNTVLDLSTELAKNNASLILGDETLDTLYSAMDTIVVETNYLITNIINTILGKSYKIKNLECMKKASDDKPYAYYFTNSNDPKLNYVADVDPLGVNCNIDLYGKEGVDMAQFRGILPLLEKILINITGENHYGSKRPTIYGGQPLVDIYDDIKNGYTVHGLTQDVYEKIYKILSESLGYLSDVHQIINAFVNEKFITEIIYTLVGTLDINNVIIKYNGSTYSVNGLFEYYNSGVDENLTQTMVTNLINEAIQTANNPNMCPLPASSSDPIMLYPYLCIRDIIDSVSIASQNKDVIKANILKQDHVLSSLNTLCYDNVVTDVNNVIGFAEGSDGSFTYDNSSAAALKRRMHAINNIRIKAYKGTWNEDVLNKDLFEFDHVFDANYEDAVKNAIITLARDERQDFFYWADTKIQNTIQDCINWKNSFTNSTYFMSIIAQSQTWYDEYTSKNINLTSTYLISDLLARHLESNGRQYPMAGSRRGIVGGFITNDWYPNEEQKEKLYANKINYLEKDINLIRIGAQNTNYPAGPLGQINNMLVLLRIKRTVEKIAKTYQFEFNTSSTRSAMAAEINQYLSTWKSNGACTVANASVYASDYDIIQKIVRVDVTLQFTGVIERIVINIDCPASI